MNPKIKIISPWRVWNYKSREDCIEYAKKNKIPITVTKQKPYSCDRNIFHVSYEGGILEDPWAEPPDSMFETVRPLSKSLNKPSKKLLYLLRTEYL